MRRTVPRWVLLVVAAAIAAAVADAVLFVVVHRGGGGAEAADRPATADTVAVIDPTSRMLVADVHVGHQPTAIRTGYGGVWVLNKDDGTLTHIDPRTHRVVGTLEPDATANALAVGAGGIWFVGHPRDPDAERAVSSFERIDPLDGKVVRSFRTPSGAAILAAGGGALWSTGILGSHVRASTREDTRTGKMSRIDLGLMGGDLVAADDAAAYYVDSIGNRAARVDAQTGRRTNFLRLVSTASLIAGKVAADPTGVALGGGSVWISETDGRLLRLDLRLHGITSKTRVCTDALAVAYGEGAAWVACSNGTVVRFDPTTHRLSAPIAVGRLPRGIAAGEGAVWVTLN
jgi:DNA-binding beta-propeller fold protein YncE